MLDELTLIPWYELDHAYGSAEEIPIWIRQLTSPDEQVRTRALGLLENAICHQGSIYPSTAYVIPFLVELLQEPEVQIKADILGLLAFLAIADVSPEELETWAWIFPSSSRHPCKDVGSEIGKGLPLYFQFLAETNAEETRVEAAKLLMLLATQTDLLQTDQREHLLLSLQPLSPLLEAEVVQATEWQTMLLVEILLFLWFPRGEQAIPWLQMQLTNQQEQVLMLFYDRADLWSASHLTYTFLDILKAYRLPEEQSVMATFLKRDLSLPQRQDPRRANPTLPSYFNRFGSHLRNVLHDHLSHQYPELVIGSWGDAIGPMGKLLCAEINGMEVNLHPWSAQSTLFFHLPDSPAAIWEMQREYQLLCLLHERLPLPVPHPLYVNLVHVELGRIFIGYPSFPGRPLYKETWECLERIEGEETVKLLAQQIASFLYTLHHIPLTDLSDVALPVIHKRTPYEKLFQQVRRDLFPHLPLEQYQHIATSFSTFLNTPHHFTLMPALVHGSFGPQRIFYNGPGHAISGIIGFTHAGLGDPAYDIATLFGPSGYGKKFKQFFEEAYPDLEMLQERIQFYVNASSLQETYARYGQHASKHIADSLAFYGRE